MGSKAIISSRFAPKCPKQGPAVPSWCSWWDLVGATLGWHPWLLQKTPQELQNENFISSPNSPEPETAQFQSLRGFTSLPIKVLWPESKTTQLWPLPAPLPELSPGLWSIRSCQIHPWAGEDGSTRGTKGALVFPGQQRERFRSSQTWQVLVGLFFFFPL